MPFNPPKTKRNAEIYALYLEDGHTLASLARKYQISPGRVREIIDAEERRTMKEEKRAIAERGQ
jgi:Mor family transcriptional regulator